MHSISKSLEKVVGAFSKDFTQPTFRRFVLLVAAAIITPGMHTVSNLLRCLGRVAPGHPTTYHHVFSARRWRPLRLARTLASLVIDRFAGHGTIELVGDDTVLARPGDHVFGKGRHRDSLRSSRVFRAFHFGHKWVVLAVLVRLPFSHRRWALPVMATLATTKVWDSDHGHRHRTPPELMEGMLTLLLRWFPGRKFRFAGDRAFSTHRLARLAACSHGRLTLVSRFYAAAALYSEIKAKPKGMGGRARQKGEHLPPLAKQVAKAKAQTLSVSWYGAHSRLVAVVTGTGYWYKARLGAIAVRWVHVKDLSGTHRSEYFFTTDTTMTPKAIIAAYTGRWNIETTFQEVKSLLKVGTTRSWAKPSVLRQAPCLFGLYSIVTLVFSSFPKQRIALAWPGKRDLAFSDALCAVRRHLWRTWLFREADKFASLDKLTPHLQEFLLRSLAPAA